MENILTPELLAAFFALLQNPVTAAFCWAMLVVIALWVVYKLCTALTELIKVLRPSK